jgi:hypothetical protein
VFARQGYVVVAPLRPGYDATAIDVPERGLFGPLVSGVRRHQTQMNGQIAIRIDLIEREDDPVARLQIFVPSGSLLQPGVKLAVDQGSFAQIPTWRRARHWPWKPSISI